MPMGYSSCLHEPQCPACGLCGSELSFPSEAVEVGLRSTGAEMEWDEVVGTQPEVTDWVEHAPDSVWGLDL